MLAAVALWASASALADEPAKAKAPPAEKPVCHYEKQLGSHMRTKVCVTPAQARAAEEAARQAMDEARDIGHHGTPSSGE